MSKTSTRTPESTREHWHGVTLALLVGVAVLGGAVFLVTVLRAPVGPPVETAPLFVWNSTAAAIAFVLTGRRHRYGYPAAALTRTLVLASLAVIATSGGIDPTASPLGPVS